MATAYQLKTFADIYTAVMEELKYQSSDTVSKNRIKRDINMIYLDEVVPYEQWKWLRGHVNVNHEPAYTTGTVNVTQNSVTATLTIAPATSRKGHYLAVDGFDEIYRVAQHTANTTTLVLENPFNGASNSTSSYKLWTDKIPLPVDCRDTVQVTQDNLNVPMESMGIQMFRRTIAGVPRAEGKPKWYCTSDYVDPVPYGAISGLPALSTSASSGLVKTLQFASTVASLITVGDHIEISGASHYSFNGEAVVSTVNGDTITYTGLVVYEQSATADASLVVKELGIEADVERYKELWVYPSVYNTRSVLHVDYTKEAQPLVEDDDEPLMPLGDRMVLVYGALMRAWSRERNPEESDRNSTMYNRKLSKMAGKLDDSTDLPLLRVGKSWLAAKRQGYRSRSAGISRLDGIGTGGGGGQPAINGSANTVAVYDSLGQLTSSALISTTELNFLDNVGSAVLGKNDTGTFTNKSIDGDDNTITDLANGSIKVGAAIDVTKLAAIVAQRVVVSDASGFISASAVTSAELLTLAGAVALTTVSLLDNQGSAADVFTFAAATYPVSIVEYSVTRGTNLECGSLMVVTDATNVNMTQVTSQVGTPGVTLTADVSGANVRIRYTSTNSGTAPTFKYTQRKLA